MASDGVSCAASGQSIFQNITEYFRVFRSIPEVFCEMFLSYVAVILNVFLEIFV